ncbi:MAG: efflux RND transporter periplasmic adaptor subunit [Trinickia sp.]
MKLRLILLSVVSLGLAGAAGVYIYRTVQAPSASQSAAQPAQAPTVQTVNGETVVVVSAESQRASHISVAPLSTVTSQPSISAYATVVDLQPLFDLRNRLASARADLGTFAAQAAGSRAQYERSRALYADDRNVSQKALQEAQSAMQADRAKLQSARATLEGLDGAVRQQFGDALANATTASGSKLLQRLQSGQAVIVRVTLPGKLGALPPARISIDTPGAGSVQAQRLGASPLADPSVQGSPWLYVANQALPANMHADARVPTSSQAVSGLLIPERAVVWYGGQTWVYVRTAPERFTRRFVPSDDEGDEGFFVQSGFHAGDEVVTQGAQLLLSQELKPQGIGTACKDPPECDD